MIVRTFTAIVFAASTFITIDTASGQKHTLRPPATSETPTPAEQPELAGPRGIYLFSETPTTDADLAAALSVSGVDGLAVVVDWSALQPTEGGAFNFESLDTQFDWAKAHHLSVELAVRAGANVPGWLMRAQALRFGWSPHRGVGRCQDLVMPPPWDSAYQSAFATMLEAVASHVRQKGADLAVVKLTGINTITEELRLPAEAKDQTGQCGNGGLDDVAVWQGAGYRPALVQQALGQLATTFAHVFPQTPVTLAIIPRRGFPSINDQGQIVKNRAMAALNQGLIATLVSETAHALPGRFILQFDFLMFDQPANAVVVGLARANHVPLAWQTNLWLGALKQGAACGGPPGPKAPACSDEQYLNLLEEGVHPQGGSGPSAQARFIEVFPYDVIKHPQVIAKVHAELTSEVPSPPPPPHSVPTPKCAPGSKCPSPI